PGVRAVWHEYRYGAAVMDEAYGAKLPRRRLGRTNLEVPALGLGGAGIGGVYGDEPERDAIETVRYAVEQGITFIDTDASYGDSERRIGIALQDGLRRHVVLSTKCGTHPERRGDYSWDGTRWNVENSLRVLKTDYIDLLLVHDPPSMEPVMARRGALEALEALKEQGVIGFIGLGQRRHDFHRQAIESGRFDVILTYNDYNPIRTTAADWLLPLAARHGIGVINGSPLAMGLLAGEDPDQPGQQKRMQPWQREVKMARRLYHWCEERGIPEPAIVFQFCLRQPLIHCTITGAKTRAELEEDLKAATMALPEGIWDEVAALHLTEGQMQPGEH
ncbi:MAG: aldo/keto reductase, partial [Armatimonadota bacterium]|nr:aldo/keto reductase [Armatimonadota bacterium]